MDVCGRRHPHPISGHNSATMVLLTAGSLMGASSPRWLPAVKVKDFSITTRKLERRLILGDILQNNCPVLYSKETSVIKLND